jgi:hypothetical protein
LVRHYQKALVYGHRTKEGREVGAFAKEQFTFLKAEKGFTWQLINQPANGLLIYRDTTTRGKDK